MESNQVKLNPHDPKDAVTILSLATEQLSGPNAGSRMFAVSVQIALDTLKQSVEDGQKYVANEKN